MSNGPTTAPIILTDNLPTGITLRGTPTITGGTLSGCPSSGSDITGCVIAAGANAGVIKIDIPVAVAATAASTTGIRNTASISGGGDPACPAGNTVCNATSLTIVLSAMADIDTKQPGISSTSSLFGNDVFPLGSSFALGTGSTCSNSSVSNTGVASYTSPASAAGSCTVAYTVCAPAPNSLSCSTAILTVTTSSSPDIVVSKTHAPSLFTVGNVGIYTIKVGNAGYLSTVGEYTVTDTLPAGMIVKAKPTGINWDCSTTVVGSMTMVCKSSTVIMPSTIPPAINYSANEIKLLVMVENNACVTANSQGQCSSALINKVKVDGGGETITPFYTDNNTVEDSTAIQQSSSLSGIVWQDINHDRQLNSGELPVGGMIIEVVDNHPSSLTYRQVVATVASNSPSSSGTVGSLTGPGSYQIAGLVPNQAYTVRFRDSDTNGIFYGIPTIDHTSVQSSATGTTVNTVGGTSTIINPNELSISLRSGENMLNQSLPLDPFGVVYDSVTRLPVTSATVTLMGPAGFEPSLHLAAASRYVVSGQSASMKSSGFNTPLPGAYQFLLVNTAPPGVYKITVKALGYTSFTAGTVTVDSASSIIPASTAVPSSVSGTLSNNVFTPTGTGNVDVNGSGINGNPPPNLLQDTTYFLGFNLRPANGAAVVNNHIPMDPASQPKLLVSKIGDKVIAEVGDSVRYTVKIKRVDDINNIIPVSEVIDNLPAGFRYIDGTAQLQVGDGAVIKLSEPLGRPGPVLKFNIGAIVAKSEMTLSYRVRLGVGAQKGTGINRASATVGLNVNCALPNSLCSNEAQHTVKVTGGVLGVQSCVIGKVYMDCNNNHVQDSNSQEMGIPSVRLYLQDGTSVTTDVEGKYSLCDLDPKLNVLVLDQSTLPRGSVMTTSSSRNAGDAMSLFLDLKNGDMQRADFIETACYDTVIKQVKARKLRDDANQNVIKVDEHNQSSTNSTNVLEFESSSVNTIMPAVVR